MQPAGPAPSQLDERLEQAETAPAAELPAPVYDEIVPADPTQLPPVPGGDHAGCSCASCRGGGSGPPPPGVLPSANSWFGGYGDCPKAVISEGWCRRPYYVDAFIGAISGNELIDNQISQQTSFLGGLRLGWDLDEKWGVETRLAVSEVDIANFQDPFNDRTADLLMWDVSLVHYFLTDLRIRPFLSVGVGVVDWEYVGADGLMTDDKVVGVPVGIGVKHRYDDWLVFRLDLTDNIAFGGGTLLGTQHNMSITASCEVRFGGPRVSYWPWQPRKYYSW